MSEIYDVKNAVMGVEKKQKSRMPDPIPVTIALRVSIQFVAHSTSKILLL